MARQNEPLSADVYPPEVADGGFTVQNATSQTEKSLLRARWCPGNKSLQIRPQVRSAVFRFNEAVAPPGFVTRDGVGR